MWESASAGKTLATRRSRCQTHVSKKPERFSDANREFVETVVHDVNIYITTDDDSDALASMVSNGLYTCSVRDKSCDHVAEVRNDNLRKWETLLQDKDDGRVWLAINGIGNFDVPNYEEEVTFLRRN